MFLIEPLSISRNSFYKYCYLREPWLIQIVKPTFSLAYMYFLALWRRWCRSYGYKAKYTQANITQAEFAVVEQRTPTLCYANYALHFTNTDCVCWNWELLVDFVGSFKYRETSNLGITLIWVSLFVFFFFRVFLLS